MTGPEENQFRIRRVPLKPNHLFMDIHKGKEESHEKVNIDAFAEYRDYRRRIGLLFSDLPDEHRFWLKSGVSVKGLHELYVELGNMSDETYSHHVNQHKNDFAAWVKNIYQDEELSSSLLRARTRLEAKEAIERRIDSIIGPEEGKDEKNIFKSLISKLSKQNQKLEKELIEKKDWLNQKQHDLELWEARNVDHEKKLYNKYKVMEQHEQHLYSKFKKLQEQEEKLNTALGQEKKEIEKQKAELKQKQQEHELMKRSALFKKHEPVYTRLDELMSYATACIFNKNYKEARDSMSKVKYYYNTLPNEDPKKKEFYAKIIKLRNYISDALKI